MSFRVTVTPRNILNAPKTTVPTTFKTKAEAYEWIRDQEKRAANTEFRVVAS